MALPKYEPTNEDLQKALDKLKTRIPQLTEEEKEKVEKAM